MGLEVMAESVRAGTHSESSRERIQIVGDVTLKLWASNEVQTNVMEEDWYLTT